MRNAFAHPHMWRLLHKTEKYSGALRIRKSHKLRPDVNYFLSNNSSEMHQKVLKDVKCFHIDLSSTYLHETHFKTSQHNYNCTIITQFRDGCKENITLTLLSDPHKLTKISLTASCRALISCLASLSSRSRLSSPSPTTDPPSKSSVRFLAPWRKNLQIQKHLTGMHQWIE